MKTFIYYFEMLCTLFGVETNHMRAERVARMQRAIDIDRDGGIIAATKTGRNIEKYDFDKRAERIALYADVCRPLDAIERGRYIYGHEDSIMSYSAH